MSDAIDLEDSRTLAEAIELAQDAVALDRSRDNLGRAAVMYLKAVDAFEDRLRNNQVRNPNTVKNITMVLDGYRKRADKIKEEKQMLLDTAIASVKAAIQAEQANNWIGARKAYSSAAQHFSSLLKSYLDRSDASDASQARMISERMRGCARRIAEINDVLLPTAVVVASSNESAYGAPMRTEDRSVPPPLPPRDDDEANPGTEYF